MNRKQALAKLRPILGKHLAYREDDSALVGEAREAAGEARRAAHAHFDAVQKARDERRAAVLAADSEYQRLRAEYSAAYEACGEASSKCHRRRITVGTCGGPGTLNGMFFSVRAEGDNWQEVVDKLTQK